MSSKPPDFELQKRHVADGWVEVRMVYQTNTRRAPDYQTSGMQARVDIAIFGLTFAADVAATMRAPILARELTRLRDHIQSHSKGDCPDKDETRH